MVARMAARCGTWCCPFPGRGALRTARRMRDTAIRGRGLKMKKPEEIKKGLVEAVAEMFWATKDGDDNAMRRACGMAHTSMADALVYIQQLEAKVTNLERVRATQATSVTTMQDALFKQQLHQSRLLEERSQLEARVPRWIPVEESMPEGEGWVLVIGLLLKKKKGNYGWCVPHVAEYRHGRWCDSDGMLPDLEDRSLKVTHWMPLPEPPEEVRHD